MALRRSLVLASARHLARFQSLQRLGSIHGTDKASHVHNGRSNLQIYETYLRPWRRRSFTLLEIGVYRGDSLRAWRSYFRNATIIGLDIDPQARERVPDFELYIGSQSDDQLLDRIVRDHPDLALVIDDGSHLNPLTFASFHFLFPRLPAGALYMIEDLAPGAYGPDWPGAEARNVDGAWGTKWPGMEYNQSLSLLDNRQADLECFRNELAYDCDLSPWDDSLPGHVAFLHQWPSIAVIGRA
jgi:hypothetical protein